MSKVTRRHVLTGMLVAGGTLTASALLAACGGQPAATTTVPTAATATTAPAAGAAAPAQPAATPVPTPITAKLTLTQFALGGKKLVAWSWQSFSPEADRFIADQATQWGKQNGGEVEYDIIQNSVFNQKLAAAIEAKTLPDLIMIADVLHNQQLGILTDLTDQFNKLDKLEGGFYKSLLPGIQTDGKIWGIPLETGPSPLFTRIDLMEQVTGKREPPKTLDEMESTGTKMNKPPNFYAIGLTLGRTPDCDGNVSDIMRQDGGFKVNKEGTKPTIQSDGTIAALQRIKKWWDAKLIPADSTSWDDTGNNSAYQSKRVAFVDNPASIYGWLVQNDQDLLKNTSMAPIPGGKAGSFSGGAGGWCWTLSNTSKNKDAGIALIDFLTQPDNLEIECELIGGRWYPPYINLAKRPFWTSKPQFSYYPELTTNSVYDSYPAPPTPKLMAALGEAGASLLIADMAQSIVVNNTPIDKAVADTQAKFEAIFKKYQIG